MLPIIGTALGTGLEILKKLIPDPQARREAELKLIELNQAGELKELDAAMQVIVAEANSEHAITATWRPITMLTFVGLVVAHFLGFTAPNITEVQVDGLLKIVQYGLTGYILGRSTEKGIKEWKK
jgi:hypothetical protein